MSGHQIQIYGLVISLFFSTWCSLSDLTKFLSCLALHTEDGDDGNCHPMTIKETPDSGKSALVLFKTKPNSGEKIKTNMLFFLLYSWPRHLVFVIDCEQNVLSFFSPKRKMKVGRESISK